MPRAPDPRPRQGDSGPRAHHDGRHGHPGGAARMSSPTRFHRSGLTTSGDPDAAWSSELPGRRDCSSASGTRAAAIGGEHSAGTSASLPFLLAPGKPTLAGAHAASDSRDAGSSGTGAARIVEASDPDRRPGTTRPSHATATRWPPQPNHRRGWAGGSRDRADRAAVAGMLSKNAANCARSLPAAHTRREARLDSSPRRTPQVRQTADQRDHPLAAPRGSSQHGPHQN